MARRSNKKNKLIIKYVQYAVSGILILFILFFACKKTAGYFKQADLFEIKEIVMSPSLQFIESRHLRRLKGKSIFGVDLQGIQRQLQFQYPEIDQLKVSKKFPDKLYISAKKRYPFIVVSNNGNDIVLDSDCMVLSFDFRSGSKLPYVSGVSMTKKPVLGKPLKIMSIKVVVDIIKEIESNKDISSRKISSVDVSNLSKIVFYFSDNLKVVVDRYKIKQKINKLGILLSQGNLNFKNVDYIDLRFKEPLLGKK